MRHNIQKGLNNYLVEGEHYQLLEGYDFFSMDGFTDSIMLENAVYPGTGDPLRDAMASERLEFTGCSKVESLAKAANGETNGTVMGYARYWHGYLVFLKPLLLIFSLSGIRMINMTVQLLLAAIAVALAYRRGGVRLAIPFGFTILCLNPLSIALSFQLSDIYLLMLSFAIVLMGMRTYEKKMGWMLYLWLGILTAFFDFLTYPLMALGVILILEQMLTEGSRKERFQRILLCSFAWLFGYGGMWAGKWVMASILTGSDVIANAIGAVEDRASTTVGGKRINVFQVIWHNVRLYLNPAMLVLFVAAVVLLLYCAKKGMKLRINMVQAIPMAFVGLYPFAWYCALKNHSIVHPFLEHKNIAISVMALGCILGSSLYRPGKKEEIRH